MNPVVFLDIDGVLNTHGFDPLVKCGQIHPDKVKRLNAILEATGADIVVSSAWRYLVHRGEMNLRGLEWLLRSHGVLADRLIGITREDTRTDKEYDGIPGSWHVLPNERGQQIADWLAENGKRPYVVLDDLDLGISGIVPWFVHTRGYEGLTDRQASVAITFIGHQERGVA